MTNLTHVRCSALNPPREAAVKTDFKHGWDFCLMVADCREIQLKSGPIYQGLQRGIQTLVTGSALELVTWVEVWLYSCVQADGRLTCWTRAPGSLLWLRGPVTILLPALAAGRAGGADVHFADFEESHHKRLLLQWTVAAYKPHLLKADALSCLRKHNTLKYIQFPNFIF